jgi:hypothetical protein
MGWEDGVIQHELWRSFDGSVGEAVGSGEWYIIKVDQVKSYAKSYK